MKHFLFLTTTNLAANPRLTKEVNLALTHGHKTTVIMFFIGNWSDAKSGDLARELEHTYPDKVSILALDATSKNWISWFFLGLMEKLAKITSPMFKNSIFINSLAHSRRSIQLLKKSRTLNLVPDVIIGHTLGALFPAYHLGIKFKVPFVFDVEDYHPREAIPHNKYNEIQRREFLMKKLLPHAEAFTIASPLIEKYTLELIGELPSHFVILNSFPEGEFISPAIKEDIGTMDLKLIWFSQKIGFGRGLEQFFQVIRKISTSGSGLIRITLIGECDSTFKEQIIAPFLKIVGKNGIEVKVIPSLSQKELHSELSLHDVGLALEWNTVDLNRQICLTNKIMAYAQAGLYILATNTKAQTQFIKEHPDLGRFFGQTETEMLQAIREIIKEQKFLKQGMIERYNLAKSISWEQESQKILKLWMNIRK